MKIRAVDFETTDKTEAMAKGKPVGIIEAGWTDVSLSGEVSRPKAMLVNPNIPIEPEARGVHHISNAMLEGAPTPGKAFMALMDGMEPGDMFVAHHIDFERTFFAGGAHPWLCTLKCAQHLWEEAPGHSNQTLRYWLDIEDDFEWPELTMPPHRAGPDSYVTAHILARMLQTKSPAQLLELTTTPVLLKTVSFGKYAGELWSSMDDGYLNFILDPTKGPFKEEVLYTARYWRNRNRGLSGTPFA